MTENIEGKMVMMERLSTPKRPKREDEKFFHAERKKYFNKIINSNARQGCAPKQEIVFT